MMTVKEAAGAAGVSQATMVRLAQKLGLSGFPELKLVLARSLGHEESIYERTLQTPGIPRLIQETLEFVAQTLRDSSATLDATAVAQAVGMLQGGGKIVLVGVGGSGAIAELARQRFLEIGLFAIACADPPTMPRLARTAVASDVYIGVSHHGRTIAVSDCLKIAKLNGAQTIAVTSDPCSVVAEQGDVLLQNLGFPTSVGPEAGIARVGQIMVFDILNLALSAGFSESAS